MRGEKLQLDFRRYFLCCGVFSEFTVKHLWFFAFFAKYSPGFANLALRRGVQGKRSIFDAYLKKQNMRTMKIGAMLLVTALIAGCSSQEAPVPVVLENLEFQMEGPLFEGPNPSQVLVQLDLPTLLGDKYEEGMTLNDAHLTSVEVTAADSLGLEGVKSFVLSLASDDPKVGMVEAAFLNPLEAGVDPVQLNVSEEAKLGDFFKGTSFYLVLDADLAQDFMGNRTFKVRASFDVHPK
jgi:hypothetical protein